MEKICLLWVPLTTETRSSLYAPNGQALDEKFLKEGMDHDNGYGGCDDDRGFHRNGNGRLLDVYKRQVLPAASLPKQMDPVPAISTMPQGAPSAPASAVSWSPVKRLSLIHIYNPGWR